MIRIPCPSLTVIRVVLAISVLIGHAPALHYYPNALLHLLNQYPLQLGSLAVDLFFGISGVLVTKSALRSYSPLTYAALRAIRIIPALCVCLLVTIFVIGPITSTLHYTTYFTNPLVIAYFWNNISFNTSFVLPGVFAENVYQNSVNGSLWTLRYEVFLYLVIGLARYLKHYFLTSLLCYSALIFYLPYTMLLAARVPLTIGISTSLLTYLNESQHSQFSGNRGVIFCVLSCSLLVSGCDVFRSLLTTLFLIPIVHLLLMSNAAIYGLSTRCPDISYGVYIYAFPIQQVVELFLHETSLIFKVISDLLLSIIAGMMSYKFVEKPLLMRRQAISGYINERINKWRILRFPI